MRINPLASRSLFLHALAPFLLLGTAFALIAVTVGLGDVHAALKAVSPQAVALMLCASAVNFAARAIRWILMFRIIDPESPGSDLRRVPQQVLVYIGGYAFTVTPGRAGEAVRIFMAHKSFGTRIPVGASLVVADRFYDAIALTLILLVTVALHTAYVSTVAVMFAVLGGAVVFLGFAADRPGLWRRATEFAPRFARPIEGLRDMIAQLSVLSRPRNMPLLALVSVGGWTAQGLVPAIALRDMETTLGLSEAVFTFALATLVGGATFLPGGIGGFEATMIALLSTLNIPLATAVAATLVVRLTTLWFGVSIGVALLTVWTFLSRGHPTHSGEQ